MDAHSVRRPWRLVKLAAFAAVVASALPAAAADRPPADQLLPKTTVAFVTIALQSYRIATANPADMIHYD